MIQYNNKMRKKNPYKIYSTDTEKAFNKAQHPFMIKTLYKIAKDSYLNIVKVIYEKSIAFHNQWGKTEDLLFKTWFKARMISLVFIFNKVQQIPSSEIG